MEKLPYSNKTIIEHLKSLTKLGVLEGDMEKTKSENRIVWVKSYQLTRIGKWFVLLLAEEKELSRKEKSGNPKRHFQGILEMGEGSFRKAACRQGNVREDFHGRNEISRGQNT